jgi:similar to stage IV sporulation protein
MTAPSNLVAQYDSQIERLEVLGGDIQVKYLQTVKKGELLVSGIIDSEALGYRLVRSRGKVFARTTLSFESQIPFEYTKKTYTGNEICKKSVIFFAKSFNLFKKSSIPYEKYDTIVSSEKLYLFGKIELPISVTTVRYVEYENVRITLSENDALKMALADIGAKSADTMAEAEILSKKTEVENTGSTLRVRTEIYCIIDIAREVAVG